MTGLTPAASVTDAPDVVRRSVERPAPAEDVYALAERRRAAGALLRKPLLRAATDGDDLRLVRAHAGELTRMFADRLGYRLVIDPGLARLYKTGLGRDATRPLLRRSEKPFTPRAYALLCLTIAALTRSRTQLLIDELVREVRSAAVDAALDVDLDAIADRRALHAALGALIDLGVLRERDGDLEHWVVDRTQSLLDVDRECLAALIAGPIGSAASADELLEIAALPSAAGGARVAVRRLLVEQPVVSVAEMTEEQAEWWRRNRNREREFASESFGLELELRSEGAVGVDADGDLTDLDFPGPGSAKHVALLLLDQLVPLVRARRDPAAAWVTVTAVEVHDATRSVVSRWRAGLRKDHRDDPARAQVDAREVLLAMGLVRVTAHGDWQMHAAAARFAARPQLNEISVSGERSLFDDADDADDAGDDER